MLTANKPILSRQALVRVLLSVLTSLPTWALSSYLLCRLYDIRQLIVAGHYSDTQAMHPVMAMGLIATALVGAVWVYTDFRYSTGTYSPRIWKVTAHSMLVLGLYGAAVVIRRELWRPNQGLSDNVMFLPGVGSINAVFFSEYGWLTYFFAFAPIVAVASGIAYQLKVRTTDNLVRHL